MEPSSSPKYQLNSTDLLKALRGMVVVLAGAALTYVTEQIGSFDFGPMTPVVVSLAATFIELARRWLSDYSAQ